MIRHCWLIETRYMDIRLRFRRIWHSSDLPQVRLKPNFSSLNFSKDATFWSKYPSDLRSTSSFPILSRISHVKPSKCKVFLLFLSIRYRRISNSFILPYNRWEIISSSPNMRRTSSLFVWKMLLLHTYRRHSKSLTIKCVISSSPSRSEMWPLRSSVISSLKAWYLSSR